MERACVSKSLGTWTRWISCLPVINTHFLLPRRALAPRRDQQRCVRWQILGVARLGYSPWVFSDCRRYFHTRAGLPHKKEQIEPASSGRSQRFVSQSPNRPSPTFPRASRDGCGQERNEQTEIPPRSLSPVREALTGQFRGLLGPTRHVLHQEGPTQRQMSEPWRHVDRASNGRSKRMSSPPFIELLLDLNRMDNAEAERRRCRQCLFAYTRPSRQSASSRCCQLKITHSTPPKLRPSRIPLGILVPSAPTHCIPSIAAG